MRDVIKVENTTYEVDNPKTAAALRQCKTEAAAEKVMQQAAEARRKRGRRVGE